MILVEMSTISKASILKKRQMIEKKKQKRPFDGEGLIAAVEAVLGMFRNDLYGSGENAQAVMAKEVLILTGRQTGASFPQLANLTGLDASTVSRRYEAAKRKARTDAKLAYAKDLVTKKYGENIALLHVRPYFFLRHCWKVYFRKSPRTIKTYTFF